jgi:hypothetical protein
MQNPIHDHSLNIGNSLPRHLRATLPAVPTTSQLLETTALPFALLIQPFAQLRYDESPIPLVSNWVSGESAFDTPRRKAYAEEEEGGPIRCDRCRGYVNPWVRWMDGGRKWGCNLCGNANPGAPSLCHFALHRLTITSPGLVLLSSRTVWAEDRSPRPTRITTRHH